MNAPDKIYVAESLIKTRFGNEWSPTPYISRKNTEYVRKDVLLETIGTARESAVIQKNFNSRPAEQEARIDAYEYIVRKIESL